MSRKRRYQWIDAIQATEIAVVGAAAPGTIVNTGIVLETELENVGGGATLIRVVGDIWMRTLLGVPIATFSLYLQEAYAGAIAPTDWDTDTFQRRDMLGTWMLTAIAGQTLGHVAVDLRTKRKMGQGVALDLAAQNHSIAGQDMRFVFHLRALLLLP